jgi:hypothetical protein
MKKMAMTVTADEEQWIKTIGIGGKQETGNGRIEEW